MQVIYEPELDLFPPARDTTAQRFDQFNRANPGVYWAIRAKANELLDGGAKRLSMKCIFELLRGQFKHLDNSFTSYYTDLLIMENPRLDAYFERRAREVKTMALHYVRK